jgi:D-alanyl-D-alanine dipeptidase
MWHDVARSTASARHCSYAFIALLATCGCAGRAVTPAVSPATSAGQPNLVDIATLVPDIALEIRYAGSDNFVGRPIDGYLAPKCLLLRPVAQALQRVDASLRLQHLRMKLFDCYRPVRAVLDFVRWAEDLPDQRTKPHYYPKLDKRALLGDYIAPVSGHSRGATLDLTLLQCDANDADCRPLDMGTDFDFFDPRANTESPDITRAQRANRERLRAAMTAQGFRNYPLEWWHYTLVPEPTPGLLYDVPVQ